MYKLKLCYIKQNNIPLTVLIFSFSPLPFRSDTQVKSDGFQVFLYLKAEAEINVYSPFGFP